MMGKSCLSLNILNQGTQVLEVDAIESRAVSGLKILIQKKLGIKFEDQLLFFNGKGLCDSHSLSEIGIHKEECASVNLIVKPTPPYQGIPVKLMSEEVVKVPVKSTDSVKSIKSCLQMMLGVPPYKQILTLRDKELDDQTLVSDLQISYKEKLQLNTRHGQVVNFKGIGGTVIPIEVEFSDSIYKLKGRIQQVEGIPRDSLSIVYKGKTLLDSQTLDDYHIKPDSVLYFYQGK